MLSFDNILTRLSAGKTERGALAEYTGYKDVAASHWAKASIEAVSRVPASHWAYGAIQAASRTE